MWLYSLIYITWYFENINDIYPIYISDIYQWYISCQPCVKGVCSLVDVMDELGNHFEKESEELIALHTMEFASSLAVENVRKVVMTGKEQFFIFITERLVDRTKSIYDVNPRNKFKIFGSPSSKTACKGKQQIASLKNDAGHFSRCTLLARWTTETLTNYFVVKIILTLHNYMMIAACI